MAISLRVFLAFALLLGLSPMLLATEAAQASTGQVKVTPSDGEVGTQVRIEGTGFHRPRGTISFGDTQVTSFKPTREGTFSVSFTVPEAAAGSHPVTAQNASATASAPFTVLVPTSSDPEPEPEPTDPEPEPTDPEPEPTDPDPEPTDPDPESSDPVRDLFGPAPALGVALPSNAASDAEFDAVSSVVGESPSIELWYRSFTQELRASELDAIAARGALPYLTWEPWDWRKGVDQPDFRLAHIADGAFDDYLARSARTLRDWERPVLLRFAHEMNGDWYPWSEAVNGNQPGDYVRAWNRVQDIFQAEGATNVVWVWSPNVEYPGSLPLEDLYPGQDRVDLIAVDGYNFGTSQSWSSWISPAALFDPTFATVRDLAPDKPLLLGEVASSELGGDKAAWNRELLEWTAAQPDLVGFVWFHLDKETDWRIDSSGDSATAFRDSLAALR